jgi:hypothetical protein
MRAMVIALVVVAAAAIGIAVWRSSRVGGPPASPELTASAPSEDVAAPPAAAQPPPPVAVPAVTPEAAAAAAAKHPGWPVVRVAARDGGAAPLDAGADDRARFRALHQALASATPDAARLYANFIRMKVAAPAEAKTLIAMKQRGVPQDQLVAYVKSSFPPDLPARAIALRWLGVGGGAAVGVEGSQPSSDPRSVTGTLTRSDAGPSP